MTASEIHVDGKRWGLLLVAVVLGLIGYTVLATGACKVTADDTPPPDRCSMGGFRAGQAAPTFKKNPSFIKQTPSIYRPSGGDFYWVPGGGVFVRAMNGKIVDVVREWGGDDAGKVYSALVEKYGEPSAPAPIMPTVKSGYALFGGSVRLEYHVAWQDKECGQRIEMIRQDKTVITGFGGGSAEKITVVVSAADVDPKTGESNILK